MNIVLLEPLAIPAQVLKQFSERLNQLGHSFIAYDSVEKDTQQLISRVQDADILIIANNPLNGQVIRSAKKLKYIAIAFTGYDHVDLAACKEMGIKVSNAQGYATEAVAELALGMIISLLRRVLPCDLAVRSGGTKAGLVGSELGSKTIGIIGTGAIGLRTAELLSAFNCTLLGYSRSKSAKALALGIQYLSLEDLLAQSDIVSLHVPLNEKTRGLIGQKQIALMKPSAILINTARGPIMDSQALAQALNEGKIAGAGIDVFETEPPIAEHPLFNAKNTILTPHVAFATEESMVKRAHIVFDNVYAWLSGKHINPVIMP